MSLLPSATEIVFAIGRGDDLVGVTFECDFPIDARRRRVVSTSTLPDGLSASQIDAAVSERLAAGEDLYRLNAGALSELNADVVLTQDLCAVCAVDIDRLDDALDHLGCSAQVVTLDPSSLGGVLDTIVQVGRVLDASSAATEVVMRLRARLDELARRVGGAPAPPVLTLEWTDPAFSAGHWVPDLIVAGGGRPVLADGGGRSQRLEWERIAAADADVVLVAPCGYHLDDAHELALEVMAHHQLPLRAAVWAVDADAYFVRPGPRLVDGAELIGQILHPDRCGEVDPLRARRVEPT